MKRDSLKSVLAKKSKTIKTVHILEKAIKKTKDDLFFDLLQKKEKIDIFEIKEQTLMSINLFHKEFSFYYAYQQMNKEIEYMGYKFPKIVFLKLYQKANKMKKKIKKYTKKYLKPEYDVIESYNPINWKENQKHNWERNPFESYNLYLKKNLLQAHKAIKDNNDLDINIVMNEKPNLIVITENGGKKKNLIYVGRLCNVYVRNEIVSNNMISMDIDDNNLNPKEYIYNKLSIPKFLIKKENEKQDKKIEKEKEKEKNLFTIKNFQSYSKMKKSNHNYDFSNCYISTEMSNNNNILNNNSNINNMSYNCYSSINNFSQIRNNSNSKNSTIVSRPKSSLNNKGNNFNLRKHEKNNLSCIKKFLLHKNDFFY